MNVMFDTNVFNHLVEGRIDPAAIPKCWTIFVTQIQHDEISRTPNSVKREQLLRMVERVEKILTESGVWGISVWGSGKWSDGKDINAFLINLKGNVVSTKSDALIGETALKNNLVLVTNDADLKRAMASMDGAYIDLIQRSNA